MCRVWVIVPKFLGVLVLGSASEQLESSTVMLAAVRCFAGSCWPESASLFMGSGLKICGSAKRALDSKFGQLLHVDHAERDGL